MRANSVAEQSAYNMGYEAGFKDAQALSSYKAGYLQACEDMKGCIDSLAREGKSEHD